MLAFSEESFGRPFDFPDFQSSYQDNNEDVIIEALGAEIEFESIDFDFCDFTTTEFPRCTSSGVPSCSSSPCSSERDYGFEQCEVSSSLFHSNESDSDVSLQNYKSKSNINRNSVKKRKTKQIEKRNKQHSRKRASWSADLNRVLTCFECSWNDLNTEKQQETLELLIGTVSQRLGLREQLQLIQIISPNANVSPSDTEFFIDFELFDDEKFRDVCQFVKKHLKLLADEETNSSNNERQQRGKFSKGKDSRNMPSSCPMKKNPMEKKILEKTSKQIRKEKRSGLFKKEQVLCIKEDQSIIPEDEELDVVG